MASQIDRVEDVSANANRKHARREPFVSLYANNATIQVTPWDFRVIFGEITGEGTDAVDVTELSEIRMSPQFAKRLAKTLIEQIKNYEQEVGLIFLPAETRRS